MLSCREVATKIASEQLEGAGVWARFRVKLHLKMCRHCRLYALQIRRIGHLARRWFDLEVGDRERLSRLERSILDSIRERETKPPNSRT